MVAVAQLVESRIVIPVVVGSSPISHPKNSAVKTKGYTLQACSPFVFLEDEFQILEDASQSYWKLLRGNMRVWHFVNEQYGLDDIRCRRLKVATLKDLNDPFEWFSADLRDPFLRSAMRTIKDELAKTRGMLCFSKSWSNPVQWSHYADRHRGLCLGFDMPDELLRSVAYSRKRLPYEAKSLWEGNNAEEIMLSYLNTKYSHWRYENEVRCYVNLETRALESGLYFTDFSDQLKLATVIVGSESRVTRADLAEAIGGYAHPVECFKARLAFSTFKVVRQRKSDLWK